MLRTSDGYLLCTNRNAFPTSTSPVYFATPNITKFDFQGNIVWERSMGTRGYGGVGQVNDLIACADGSYLAVGNSDNGAPYTPGSVPVNRLDYYAVRFHHNGDTIRTFRFGQRGTDQEADQVRATPDGGYAVNGFRYRPVASGLPVKDGEIYKLDSLFRPQWSQVITWSGIQGSNLSRWFSLFQPLATGEILAGGRALYALSTTNTLAGNAGQLTCYSPTGGISWDFQRRYQNWERTYFTSMVNHADGSALVTGVTGISYFPSRYPYHAYSAYLANVGVPYVPNLCARPPVAAFSPGTAPGSPATLLVFDQSLPGPRYGVLTAWHWTWGDGSSYDGPYPGPHTYAAVPPPGTAVTLTVTNNLGCTSTRVEYPFGPLSAMQQAQALQARLALYPNPAPGLATVTLAGLRPQPAAQLTVFNALGQVVLRTTAPVRQGTLTAALDLGTLPSGVYAVRVAVQEGTAIKRLVRE